MMISDTTLPQITALVAAFSALATAIGAIIVMVKGLGKVNTQVSAVAASLVDDKGKPRLDKVDERVGLLAKNIDGAMEELKANIAGKNLADGHAAGLEEGRLASATEQQGRVTEGERVQDRLDQRAADSSHPAVPTDTPLPVQDDLVASKIDGIVTPKLDKLQNTVEGGKE